MNKILKLLIDDYSQRKTSAEHKLALHLFCDAERAFTALLDDKQKTEYMKLGDLRCELDVVSENELGEFLFTHLTKNNL